MSTSNLLTPPFVAERFGLSVKSVLRLARSGELEATRVGRQWRFEEKALARYVARRRHQPAVQVAATKRIARRSAKPGGPELQCEGADTFL